MILSKTELIPARDRLKEADRHLAYVKGGVKQLKSVEDKRIVNDLVGAIEAQRKAVEQMLQILDLVTRCNDSAPGTCESDRTGLYLETLRESKIKRLRESAKNPDRGFGDVVEGEMLASVGQMTG
jgi:hypothetical protein